MSAALGILVLGLAVGIASPGGTMFESIAEGLGLVDKQVGSTITISGSEEEAKKTFSDAAKYVYHRASDGGCSTGGPVDLQNLAGGYPGLEDTYLGTKPPCAGMEGSLARGASNLYADNGNDMEGVFSRIEFEIAEDDETGPITFSSSDNSDDLWLERNFYAASRDGFYEQISDSCTSTILATLLNLDPRGSEIKYFGTGSMYSFFFKSADSNRRASIWMEDKQLDDGIYCGVDIDDGDLFQKSPVGNQFSDEDVDILLCPGDEGYIQMNKGDAEGDGPKNKAEAGQNVIGRSTYYPFIQITETGDCGGAGLYGENVEIEVVEDPKMVEDDLRITMDGLFGVDDRVRFQFIKNNQVVNEETVDVTGNSATLEITPADNEMNVGDYTINPIVLRCDENDNCRETPMDISQSFSIENYMYYSGYVPEEQELMGSREITMSVNDESDYSSAEPLTVREFDYTADAEIELGLLESGPSNTCEFIIVEKDVATDDNAGVFFEPGGVIEKEGSLPDRQGMSYDKTGGGPGDDSAWPVYDDITLNGRNWEKSGSWLTSGPTNTLLVDSNTGKSFELVGDLLCAYNRPDADHPSWYLCDESNTPEGVGMNEDYTIETNGREWRCEPDQGEWSQTGQGIPDTVTGVLTTEITVEDVNDNPDVLEKRDSEVIFRPGETSNYNDDLIWESLPEGDKTVEVTLNYQQRGHLRVNVREDAGRDSDSVSYINTGSYGSENVYLYDFSGGYDEIGFDYETGKDYTFRIERSGTETTWEIIENGNVQWSKTEDSNDFRRLTLESLEVVSGSYTQDAIVNIKKVEVIDQ